MRRIVGILGFGALLLAACTASPEAVPNTEVPVGTAPVVATTSGDTTGNTAPGTATAPLAETPRGPITAGSLAITPAFGGRTFDRPTELVAYPGGTYLLADQSGIITRLAGDGRDLGTFLDQRSVTLRSGNEEGLLSMALDPEFDRNRYVYLYASRGSPRRTMLARYTVTRDDTADPATELVILEFPQPFPNHNGGAIRFGADGLLYLGLGDGGSGGDPGNRAQNLQELLGKIIRIEVRNAAPGQPYRAAGDPGLAARGARPEIWAFGFRNPWRMNFDAAGTTLYVADVGQDRFEEVDAVVAGDNHGWPILEGVTCYRPANNCPRDGLVLPLATYPLRTADANCAVTAGPVIDRSFVYADFCSGKIWAVPVEGGAPVEVLDTSLRIASFGLGHEGAIYVLAHGGAIHRLTRVR